MKRTDIRTGDIFGFWTVIRESPNRKHRNVHYRCVCVCGKERDVAATSLQRGKSMSCGCSRTTHGKSGTKVYRAWRDMIQRCHNRNHPAYPDYGGRGIWVCAEWRKSFQAFYEHVGDPSVEGVKLSIDRKDSNGQYEPGNVRWATAKEQAANRRPPKRRSARKRDGYVPDEEEYEAACGAWERLNELPDELMPF